MSRAEAGATGRPAQATPPVVEGQTTDATEPATSVSGAPSGSVSAEPAASESAGSSGSVSAEPAGSVSAGKPAWVGWEPIVRVAGVVVATIAGLVTGVGELLLTPLRAGDLTSIWRGAAIGAGGGPPLGLSILVAVAANYAIAWFAVSTTGRRWAIAPPWALWTVLMMAAAGVRTPEGDYLLGGDDWVALVMILAGSLSFAVYSYRLILRRGPV